MRQKHADVATGQLADDGGKTLDYLQSVKRIELKPNPFAKKPADKADPSKKPE